MRAGKSGVLCSAARLFADVLCNLAKPCTAIVLWVAGAVQKQHALDFAHARGGGKVEPFHYVRTRAAKLRFTERRAFRLHARKHCTPAQGAFHLARNAAGAMHVRFTQIRKRKRERCAPPGKAPAQG